MSLRIGYNIDIFGVVNQNDPLVKPGEEQTRFFADPYLVPDRIHRVTF